MIGIRFCLKSPAVGSRNKHFPDASFRTIDEKAFTAVLSTTLASAAAEGSRTPPARDTGRGDVGSPVGRAEDSAVTATGDEEAGEADEEVSAGDTKAVDGMFATSEVADGTESEATGLAAALVALEPSKLPRVNLWLESLSSHGA